AINTTSPAGVAFGISVSKNEVTNTNSSYIDGISVVAVGTILVQATTHNSSIWAMALGAAVAVSSTPGLALGGAGTGAVTLNTISTNTTATIRNRRKAS